MYSKNLIILWLKLLFLVCLTVTLSSCLKDGDETIVLDSDTNSTGIPSDSKAEPNPEIGSSTTYVPNFQYTVEKENGYTLVRLDLTGVQDPETLDWLRLAGTESNGQNVWVSVDENPKGITVYNNADEESEHEILADLVFLVDNSGSMGEEADSIAKGIISWASKLANSNLNVLFGCVGYGSSYGVTGALNLSSYLTISEYLNRANLHGINRTVGFYGNDAAILQTHASSYQNCYGECGVEAMRFADAAFSFRTGANRIYVNFTDEPNQPGGDRAWSVEYVNDQEQWGAAKGAIHTVYSADTTYFNERYLYNEKPWKLSRYTGGTELYAPYNFKGVSLDKLPVTGAMQNSYVIRFTNIEEFMDGEPHTVKITILSADGRVRAEKMFTIVFGYKSEK